MKKYSVYNDRTGDCAPGNIAKDRLKRAIQSERMKLSDDVMDMMQSDLKTLIEKYLGTSMEESDMVLEISKPRFVTPIMTKNTRINEENDEFIDKAAL